jgi:hypothetical protein
MSVELQQIKELLLNQATQSRQSGPRQQPSRPRSHQGRSFLPPTLLGDTAWLQDAQTLKAINSLVRQYAAAGPLGEGKDGLGSPASNMVTFSLQIVLVSCKDCKDGTPRLAGSQWG